MRQQEKMEKEEKEEEEEEFNIRQSQEINNEKLNFRRVIPSFVCLFFFF